ncbi:MAG: HAD-IC family P-type ATPase [Bacilli bacterium]|nr:HAD-IC family P-type ATPase [Bacilli bacterium]
MGKYKINESVNWHTLKLDDIYVKLDTNKTGLSSNEVSDRLEKVGYNSLPSRKTPHFIKTFFLQFFHPIIILLLVTALFSLLIGEVVDAFFIIIVIMSDAILGSIQEQKAEKSVTSLQSFIKLESNVLRDKKKQEIDSKFLVPGDIIFLESGDKVPADIRLISTYNLSVDESFLTGESIAEEKSINKITENTPISDRINMCYAGSSVLTGRAKGVVVGTGFNTEIGKIAETVILKENTKSPLVIRMEKFTKQITQVTLVIALILSIILLIRGSTLHETFLFVITLTVSAIPEGLSVSLTVALSIAISRMSKRNVIVRKLNAVESLGSCTVIASDKTGTLTVNQQTAKLIYLPNGARFSITGEGYNSNGKIKANNEMAKNNKLLPQLDQLIKVGILANEAILEKKQVTWDYYGDSMDIALLSLGYKAGKNPQSIRETYNNMGFIPYESENKFSASFFISSEGVQVGVKGAVETVIKTCTTMVIEKGIVKLDEETIQNEAKEIMEKGYRVLAFASSPIKKTKAKHKYSIEDIPPLTFIGLIGFIDPIRKEAKKAITKCRKAGIKVIMITGDHPTTAYTIARDLNIIKAKGKVIDGKMLDEAFKKGETEFDKFIKGVTVFARVNPIQKLRIIESLKRNGEFVAVTGDGVNDAPALKSANIGVAMGSGTDIAKETGSMIIVDDNFLSIVSGIEEGRYAYDNVRKVIYLLISSGLAEVLLFILVILTGLPLPLVPVQILWLNLFTDGIQDMALAFEGGEEGVMNKKPRKPTEKIFNSVMINQTLVSGITMGIVSFIFWNHLINNRNINIVEARGYVLLLMIFMQNIHVFNCRSEYTSVFRIPLKKNKILLGGIALALGGHILATHIPIMQKILKLMPISFKANIKIFLLVVPLLIVMETFKIIRRKFPH